MAGSFSHGRETGLCHGRASAMAEQRVHRREITYDFPQRIARFKKMSVLSLGKDLLHGLRLFVFLVAVPLATRGERRSRCGASLRVLSQRPCRRSRSAPDAYVSPLIRLRASLLVLMLRAGCGQCTPARAPRPAANSSTVGRPSHELAGFLRETYEESR